MTNDYEKHDFIYFIYEVRKPSRALTKKTLNFCNLNIHRTYVFFKSSFQETHIFSETALRIHVSAAVT